MNIGQKFLHYRLEARLGQGGMGEVYRAWDERLERAVAIKCLLEGNVSQEEKQRFLAEARAAASLNHPNIATIHAVEEFEGKLFIVMEFVQGRDLREVLDENDLKPLPLEQTVELAAQIAAGLQVAHQQGIVHRDIKAGNIMLTESGQIKIMDFGLARRMSDPHLTSPGSTVGTLHYMSPEQIRGEEIDFRSDLWSFGVLLYELLTGQLPFTGAYPPAIMYAIVNEPMRPVPEEIARSAPVCMHILSRCLEKDPQLRYQNMAECLAELNERAKSGAMLLPGLAQEASPGASRRKLPLGSWKALAVGLFLLIIGLAASWWATTSRISTGTNIITSQQQLVILPIKNIGGDANQQALCDGLVETLSSALGTEGHLLGSLWVIPASEIRAQKISTPTEGFRKLGASLAVTGGLQKFSHTYRLSLNLIHARNRRQLSAMVADVPLNQVASLHEKAVLWLTRALKVENQSHKGKKSIAAGTRVPGAYEFYLQGRGYLQYPDTEVNANAAIGLFQKAIQADSGFAQAYAGLGEAYWKKYRLDKNPEWVRRSREACRKAIALDSTSAPIRVALGKLLLGTGKYGRAEVEFQHALRLDATNPDAYRGLAQALEKNGKVKQAEQVFLKAIELKPNYWGYYNALGVYYFRMGRFDEAIQQFKQVIQLRPDNQRGYINLGGLYYITRKLDEAQAVLEQAIPLGENKGLYQNLGTIYYIRGQYPKAAEMYQKVLQMAPNEHESWGNMGSVCLWIPGREKEVLTFYRKAIEVAEESRTINPNDESLLIALAQYYSMVADTVRSTLLVEQALEEAPENIYVLFGATAAYEKLGFREKALEYAGKTIARGYSVEELYEQPEFRELVADPRFSAIVEKVSAQKRMN